ncbi:MAG: thiamine diphosphokinase [Pseudomonadota bacterium]
MNFDPKSDEIRALFPVLIQSETAVTLLGGSHIDKADLVAARALAPLVVAADGGAHSALAHGVIPDAVIGDLDSFDPAIAPSIPSDRIHHIPEQDSTDFDKALRSISAPFVLALGFVGGRIDHELAAYHTLIARPTPPCVVLGSEDLVVHIPHRIDMDLPPGTRVSLFTMAPVTARLSGLKWSFDAIELSPTTRIGTSNSALGGPVRLSFDGPGTLLILPRDQLPTLLDALI